MNNMIPDSDHIIHEISLDNLGGGVLDITAQARPHHFRLVDCDHFLNKSVLRICEYSSFPTIPYSAISYVWRGNPVDPTHPSQREDRLFSVRGAEEADPISIDVLRHVCKASLQTNAQFFWLDRLCIMQTNRDDKAWQIANMQQLYQSAEVCLVLAGGLRRLVSLTEETAWIHRAWTLQEALLPKNTQALYSWELGELLSSRSTGGTFFPSTVEPRQSAMSDLPGLLRSSIAPPYFTLEDGREMRPIITMFSREAHKAVVALAAATSLTEDAGARSQAIWRSALMRTSSRPVDMVFSIMGLFDVTLDTHAFHRGDRLGATIALAQAILRKGGKPHWLGAALDITPCAQFTTFPAFPETTVEGVAFLQTRDGKRTVWELTEHSDNWLPDIPTMSDIDDDGYATICGKMFRVGVLSLVNHNDGNGGTKRPTHSLFTKHGVYPCIIHKYDGLLPANGVIASTRDGR